MSTANESAQAPGNLSSALDAGIESISQQQTVTFTQYTKSVVLADGYVFWVATGTTVTAKGSLHYSSDRQQDTDQTIAQNAVLFTSETEITELNAVDPLVLWVGAWATTGKTLKIAFSRRGSYYKQSNVWHYMGNAVYPAMESQLVASAADLPVGQIVSNSLPIWLAATPTALGLTFSAPVYPSFLVPDNVSPPYIAADIEPGTTEALQGFMAYDWPGTTLPNTGASPIHNLTSMQLMRERVSLVMYGFTNSQVIQYLAALINYSIDTDDFGFSNSPTIQDEKRTQSEISAIAMKKIIPIFATYYQSAADAIARRLILSAAVTL